MRLAKHKTDAFMVEHMGFEPILPKLIVGCMHPILQFNHRGMHSLMTTAVERAT